MATFSQESKLNKYLDLEKTLNATQFLDTVLALSFADKTSDSKKFLILAKKINSIAKGLKDTLKIAHTTEDLALAYHFTNQFDTAIEQTIVAANLYDKIHNYEKYGDCYVKLGWRINRRDLDKGIYYMKKGINILEKKAKKTSFLRIGAYNNYGVLKQRKFQLDSALYYHKKSYNLSTSLNDSIGMPYAMVEMGIIYNNLNQKEKAKNLLEESLKIRQTINDTYGTVDSYENLGNFYYENSEYKKAIQFYEKALGMAVTYSFNYMRNDLTASLYKSYENLGEFKKAYQYLKNNKQINDSTSTVKIENRIRELEIQFETAETEKELLKTRTEKAETELSLAKTKNWIFILLGSLCITIISFLAISQRNKRKAQEQITQEREKGFKAIIEAQEAERSKIARELHDGVVQQIGSIILKSRKIFSKKDVVDEKDAKELLERLENSNQDLRNISHQMMPRALKELGIIPALKDLLEGSLALSNIKYSLEHFNITERLSEKIEITIYRITQELINNIIKHSKANLVSVQLFNTNNTVILIVEDNGVGFSTDKKKKGIGLLNISSRLNMVNGKVNFEPSPKSGTLVTIKIPL
ncbi:tetratricopeptide repeat-containing sensor histidine kinase [Polaribacter sp.]|uniref:tetratricopeptide repeat-containing sensor histidine kinase n=1 Tax=Polaribacter sp. TaxID=1920175 RepID=UPI003F6C112F